VSAAPCRAIGRMIWSAGGTPGVSRNRWSRASASGGADEGVPGGDSDGGDVGVALDHRSDGVQLAPTCVAVVTDVAVEPRRVQPGVRDTARRRKCKSHRASAVGSSPRRPWRRGKPARRQMLGERRPAADPHRRLLICSAASLADTVTPRTCRIVQDRIVGRCRDARRK